MGARAREVTHCCQRDKSNHRNNRRPPRSLSLSLSLSRHSFPSRTRGIRLHSPSLSIYLYLRGRKRAKRTHMRRPCFLSRSFPPRATPCIYPGYTWRPLARSRARWNSTSSNFRRESPRPGQNLYGYMYVYMCTYIYTLYLYRGRALVSSFRIIDCYAGSGDRWCIAFFRAPSRAAGSTSGSGTATIDRPCVVWRSEPG